MSSRVAYYERPGGFEVHVASVKFWWPLVFLPFFLLGWTAIGAVFIVDLFRGQFPGGAAFAIIWLPMWAAFWVLFVYVWLWTMFGKEVIRVIGGVLSIKRDVFGRGPERTYPAHEVANLRAAGLFGSIGSMMTWSGGWAYWGLSGGTVAFEWRGKTHTFGIQLEEAEARGLAEIMRPYLPKGAAAT